MITELLVRLTVKDSLHPEKPQVRLAYGMLSGWVGIGLNLLLFLIKCTVGILSGSIAIAADALNNLSDAGSGAITVFGFKLASEPPDNEHPFGHGRLEYIAALIVAVVITAVGLNFLKESVGRIFHPADVRADNLMLAIIAGTLLFKLWLFFFYRTIGGRIDSSIIRAAAFDSLSDILGTIVILGAVFAGRFTRFPIDGCAGTVIALFVIVGGLKIIKDTANPLLGECPDKELVGKLREKLLTCKGIRGVHDIILHNYGPNQYFATAHAEVDREGDLMSMHDLLEAAEVAVAQALPVKLVLHCDPYNTENPNVKMWRARAEEAVSRLDSKLKLYDFRLVENGAQRILAFHLLTPRQYALSEEEITEKLTATLRPHDPALALEIQFRNAFV